MVWFVGGEGRLVKIVDGCVLVLISLGVVSGV
jgi:hypothetical protein